MLAPGAGVCRGSAAPGAQHLEVWHLEGVNLKLSILPAARSCSWRRLAVEVEASIGASTGCLASVAAGVWAGQGCGPLGADVESEALNPFKPHFPTAHFGPTSTLAGSLPIFLRLRGQFFLTPLPESVE